MDFQTYLQRFEQIFSDPSPEKPYNDPNYLNYTRLNWSRMNRWLKKGRLTDEAAAIMKSISEPQEWLIITEPWCGDAAHSIPFLQMLAGQNSLVSVRYELRDSAPFSIDQYLTNGSKSIPKLIIRGHSGEDLAVWGPRPEKAQQLHLRMKAAGVPAEEAKVALQNWYNTDEGKEIVFEVAQQVSKALNAVSVNG